MHPGARVKIGYIGCVGDGRLLSHAIDILENLFTLVFSENHHCT